MRCTKFIKVWTTEETFWIERENGRIKFLRVARPTWVMQQCMVTSRQTQAKCWRDHQMCGEHAAAAFPEQYPKSRGHATGGRHGLNTSNKNLLEPILVEN